MLDYIIEESLKWIMLLVLIAANTYLLARGFHFLESIHWTLGSLWFRLALISLFLIANFFLISKLVITDVKAQYYMHKIGNVWLGFIIELLTVAVVVDLVTILFRILDQSFPMDFIHKKTTICIILSVVICISIVACVYGTIHARKIYTNSFEITIQKETKGLKELNVVLIADLHLGYNVGLEEVEKTVQAVNELNPDIVFVAGDIIDNSYDSILNPDEIAETFQTMTSKYGTYAVWGNHDVEETLIGGFTIKNDKYAEWDERTISFMEKCGFTMLEDETVLIDDSFYLVGILDSHRPGNGKNQNKSFDELLKNVDFNKPVFELAHEPENLKELSEYGFDVSFCGHTHAGQFFPLTIVQPIQWENYWGMKQFGNMYSFVTSGIGVYGPYLRIGTDAEVMQIKIHFE